MRSKRIIKVTLGSVINGFIIVLAALINVTIYHYFPIFGALFYGAVYALNVFVF
ncbi:MAG: hypothetical protein GX343_03865 [Erysipelotrichaceae bacterium]|jgi:hypothetical protein|nr:hypothetical protein [Erysipelotrichaceae bacterium]